MQKVTSINLNGNAYQLDESGYDTLREYLAGAERQLDGNPDRAEIMSDLEQAIADKCAKFLGPHKSVVSASEIEQIVAEMGPVEGIEGQKDDAAGTGEPRSAGQAKEAPRRLFRIPSGAMIAGVCTGLAAYFKIDVTLVRVGFALATLLTKGAAIVAYIVMMFVVPEASTAEEQAVAGGLPFNAKEVMERAKARSTDVGREWRRQWRRQQREWRQRWAPGAVPLYAPSPVMAGLIPVFALAQMALFLVTMAMLISIVNTGAVFTWPLPADVPVWAAALILLIAYQIMVAPLRAVRHWGLYAAGGAVDPASVAFWNAVVWLIGLAFAIWLASDHIPEIRTFLQRVPDLVRDFAWAVRDLFNKPQ
jgi:phage shock protein PspC (stress-responsive transcriptional regulator)